MRTIQYLKQRLICAYLSHLNSDKYPSILSKWYFERTGNELDLTNPKALNEKIQWLKLYDSTPLKGRLADKYLVRSWVAERIGDEHLVPIVGIWDNARDIDFDLLPERFVLKATHGSGWNVIVPDKEQLNRVEAVKALNQWLKLDYAYRNRGLELHYHYCEPRIIAEEFLDFGNSNPIDYRFYCAQGKVFSIWEDVDSGTPAHKRNIYSPTWELQDVRATWPPFESPGKPDLLNEMIGYAELLSLDFLFVRVDFYEYMGKVYFGEMTFTPMSGQAHFDLPEYDYELGKAVSLPLKNEL